MIRRRLVGAQVFERLLAAQIRQAAASLRWFYDTEDIEGPHQARVALRRLRSLLKLYRPMLECGPVREIEAAAREEMRRIGPLRDADVLLTEILPMAEAKLAGTPAGAKLAARIANHRAALVKRVRSGRAALDSARLLFDLQAFQAERRWRPEKPAKRRELAAPARDLAGFALDRALAPVVRLGARLEDLAVEERHEMRKAVKTLRYAVELHAPLYRESAVKPYASGLKTLQNVFGAMNDAANAEMLREIARAPALRGAVELIIETQNQRMAETWPEAVKRWKRFAERSKFW